MQKRLTLVVTALAVLGLMVAAPLASAKTSKTDKAQNKAIKKNAAGVKKNTKAISKSTKSATAAIAALKVIADRGDKNSATLLSAAPAIIDGLTQLKNGLTTAGAGLQSLSTLTNSQEYGYLQPELNTAGGTQLGFMVTPDIPDIPQLSQTEQTFVAPTGATSIATRYGVRSNENDGDGTTAGAAANCSITMIDSTASPSIVSTQATTPVLSKATLAATAPSAGAILTGTDAPQTGPTLAVTAGDVYTIKMTCIDTTPISATNPAG